MSKTALTSESPLQLFKSNNKHFVFLEKPHYNKKDSLFLCYTLFFYKQSHGNLLFFFLPPLQKSLQKNRSAQGLDNKV